jgi:hypothetical protein
MFGAIRTKVTIPEELIVQTLTYRQSRLLTETKAKRESESEIQNTMLQLHDQEQIEDERDSRGGFMLEEQ